MFQIKICGITNPLDAAAVCDAGVDAVGLNFYPRSRRGIDLDQAREIVAVLDPRVQRVGLFVNESPDIIRRACDQLELDLVQLHGDEEPECLAKLRDLPVMRALRCGPQGMAEVAEYLDRCRQLDALPQVLLLDAYLAGSYGGTGKTADWPHIAEHRHAVGEIPLVLAGGLTAENVAEAIEMVRPDGVDTSSGVESEPGRKEPARVIAFVRAARAAFENLDRTR